MAGLAPALERLDARAQTLLVDAFPATALELLPEWEASLGLPDRCEGDSQVIQQRRIQVLARLVDSGGQSIGYFVGYLERLGYAGVTVDEFAPFRADVDAADRPLYGEGWAHTWRVNIPGLRVFYFAADVSAADEPLFSVANQVAVCVIDALKPAHTVVLYATS